MDSGDAVGGGGGEELVSSLAATPHYNSVILEDMCMKEHLAALHGICGDSEAFRDAIILGKACYQCLDVYSVVEVASFSSEISVITVGCCK